MPQETRGLYGLGGIAFIASGVLFLARYALDLVAGPPPSSGAEILAWAATHKVPLAWNNEFLFFAAVFMVPGVIALHDSLAGTERGKAAFGCGIFAVVIPVLAVLDIVHGRLVFPVFGIQGSPASAELVVAIFHGGMHAVGILLGGATLVLSLAMWGGAHGRKIAWLGFAAGVFDIVGSYPWATGPAVALVSQVLFAAWFVAVGAKLHGMR